jgi:predicted acyltransferase
MKADNSVNEAPDRLHSLDALRGFDMFWITGGSALAAYIGHVTGHEWLATQMEHPAWSGVRFYDLIFPLFMFISGVAIPFALDSKLNKGYPAIKLAGKAFRRMLILVALGIIYNGGLAGNLSNIRYVSVLGQIGIAYFAAVLIYLYSPGFRSSMLWISAILLAVAFVQLFVPVPGFGAGVLTPEGCINGYIDRIILPGRLAYGADGEMTDGRGIFDALGMLCIVSAVAVTLMGMVAGYLLQGRGRSPIGKVSLLAAIGLVLLVLSLLVHPFYPIIKKCWTSSYSLFAGGIGFILMAVFYLVIDVLHWKSWSFYFTVIGMNSVFVYLFVRFVNVEALVHSVFGWTTARFGDSAAIVPLLGYLALVWGLLYFMYRKRIFIRV